MSLRPSIVFVDVCPRDTHTHGLSCFHFRHGRCQHFANLRRDPPCSTQSTLQRWHSAECRALSDPGGRTAPRGLAFDRVHGVYRPPQAGTEVPIVRRWTWEDDIALGRLRVQGCGGFATRAWSCESAGCKAAGCSWDRQALLEPRLDRAVTQLTLATPARTVLQSAIRGTHICRRRLLCSALGLPAAIGTVQRPAKGWTLRSELPSPHALFILALEKNGLSTIDNLFQSLLRIRTHKRARRPHLNMSRVSIDMWSASGRLNPYCSRSSNLQLLEAIAANSLRPMPAGSPWSERSGCGYAATFALDAASMAHVGQRSSDLPRPRLHPARRPGGEGAGSARPRVNREPILHIATVRDPLDRFVSAYNDHGGGGGGIARCHVTQKHIEAALREGRKPPPPCPPLALELRKHAQRLADGRFITRLTPHHAGIHFFSQSYFLSATDRNGAPLEWDMLVRLERLEQE